MNDAEYAALSERIQKRFEWWAEAFGLSGEFYIKLEWHRSHKEGTMAEVECQWEYQAATIKVWVPMFDEITDTRLDHIIVHEYMHIYLNEMRDYGEDHKHEERVANTLATAIRWACEAYSKKAQADSATAGSV